MKTKHSMQKLTAEQIDTVLSYLFGFERVADETGMEIEELEEELLNIGIERCPNCGWYVESSSLLIDGEYGDEIDGFCDNCREHDCDYGESNV